MPYDPNISTSLSKLTGTLEANKNRRLLKMMQQRDNAIKQAIISGQDPNTALESMQAPQASKSILGKIMQFLQGGQINQSDIPMTPMEKIYLEEKIKNMYGKNNPKNMLSALAGFTPMETAFGKENVNQMSPLSAGSIAGGGEVLLPGGTTAQDGQLIDAQGNPAGSYLPGYEPKPQPEALRDMIFQNMGTTRQEVQRKAIGLSPIKGTKPLLKTDQFNEDLRNARAGKISFDSLREKYIGEPNKLNVIDQVEIMNPIENDTSGVMAGMANRNKTVGSAKQKSPYKQYPDAFLHNGVWKVMRNGKRYKIE